jgi:preprotein translocase subunit SecF
VTNIVLIGLAALIVVLSIVSAMGWLPALRIVPDDTKFDFTRFRRISFPISALLSILAIVLFFTHGLNFGIDFKGGTLLEVRAKTGTADIPAIRTTLGTLGLGRADPRGAAARRRRRAAGCRGQGARRARR